MDDLRVWFLQFGRRRHRLIITPTFSSKMLAHCAIPSKTGAGRVLNTQGRHKKDCLGIVHFKLHEGALVEGHELSDEVKEALDIALRDEIRRESH